MNAKKILSALLAGTMALGMLTACGSTAEPETTPASAKAETSVAAVQAEETNQYADTITLVWYRLPETTDQNLSELGVRLR